MYLTGERSYALNREVFKDEIVERWKFPPSDAYIEVIGEIPEPQSLDIRVSERNYRPRQPLSPDGQIPEVRGMIDDVHQRVQDDRSVRRIVYLGSVRDAKPVDPRQVRQPGHIGKAGMMYEVFGIGARSMDIFDVGTGRKEGGDGV